MNNSQKYFDPETLANLRPFGLRARTLMEGLVAGLHRSALRGHSIEFAQHREYAPGDDLRQVDWKVFGRSDRFHLKQYEDETNLTCYLLLDQSESMSYRGEASSLSKVEYAQLLACSLAYLVVSQQDSAGLVTFASKVEHWLQASNIPLQLDDMIRVIEQAPVAGSTDLATVLKETLARLSQPSLIILLSDLFQESEAALHALKLVKHAGHDLIVLQVLDADEIQFPFDHTTRFEGLESLPPLTTDPLLIAGAYRKAMEAFQVAIRNACLQLGGDYFPVVTNESLARRLPEILSTLAVRGR